MSSKKIAANNYSYKISEASSLEDALYNIGYDLGQAGAPKPTAIQVNGIVYRAGRDSALFYSARLGWTMGQSAAFQAA